MSELLYSVDQFEDLSNHALYSIMALRQEVFVVEQNCPYQDADGLDNRCLHICGYVDAQLVAYARVLPAGLVYKEVAIGRVVTAPKARGTGAGKGIMLAAFDAILAHYGKEAVRISAQTYLLRFYTNLGFVATGKEYLEDGIPHSEMLLPASHWN